jgi:hypothetical protein
LAFQETYEIAIEVPEELVDIEHVVGIHAGHLSKLGSLLRCQLAGDHRLLSLLDHGKDQALRAAVIAFDSYDPDLTMTVNDADVARLVVVLTDGTGNAGHQVLDELTHLIASVRSG